MEDHKAEPNVFDQVQVLVARECMRLATEPSKPEDASAHEFYARVLKCQEYGHEEVGKLFELVNAYWKAVKEGDVLAQTAALSDIRFRAKTTASEYVHLAAVAQAAICAIDANKDGKS